MLLRELYIQEQENWLSHKDLANILYTGLTALDIDPFAGDRKQVNNILSINNVPIKVLKMKHNSAYETLYSILQSAPV